MLYINTDDLPNHPGPVFGPFGPKGEESMNVTTFTLGMIMALHLGVPTITDANAAEVFARVHMWEHGTGALRRNGADGSDVYYTAEDVRQHVGLRVNAAEWTKAKFNGNLIRVMRDRAADEARREARVTVH